MLGLHVRHQSVSPGHRRCTTGHVAIEFDAAMRVGMIHELHVVVKSSITVLALEILDFEMEPDGK